MSRKKPSSHSNEQFAFFVEKAGIHIEGIDQQRFAAMVKDLVRTSPDAPRMVVAVDPSQLIDGEADEPYVEASGLLPRIRKFGFQWSASETSLIRLLALLLDTEAASAAVVFSTLAGTHARADLVRRLALLRVGDLKTRSDLGRIIDDFDTAGRGRQELIRAMFTAESGSAPEQDNEIDRQQTAAVVAATGKLHLIGQAMEELIPRVRRAMSKTGMQMAAD